MLLSPYRSSITILPWKTAAPDHPRSSHRPIHGQDAFVPTVRMRFQEPIPQWKRLKVFVAKLENAKPAANRQQAIRLMDRCLLSAERHYKVKEGKMLIPPLERQLADLPDIWYCQAAGNKPYLIMTNATGAIHIVMRPDGFNNTSAELKPLQPLISKCGQNGLNIWGE